MDGRDHIDEDMASLFQKVWRIGVPELVRYFMWLVLKGKILTNAERHRRHMVVDARCSSCRNEVESIIHVFGDCSCAVSVWKTIVPKEYKSDFFHEEPVNWVKRCIGKNFSNCSELDMDVLFATVTWWLWRWRNARVFVGNTGPSDKKSFLFQQAKEFQRVATRKLASPSIIPRQEMGVCWLQP